MKSGFGRCQKWLLLRELEIQPGSFSLCFVVVSLRRRIFEREVCTFLEDVVLCIWHGSEASLREKRRRDLRVTSFLNGLLACSERRVISAEKGRKEKSGYFREQSGFSPGLFLLGKEDKVTLSVYRYFFGGKSFFRLSEPGPTTYSTQPS